MILFPIAALVALAIQSAPAGTAGTASPPASLDALPIEQSAAPRCAVAFAVVSRWQKAGDARGDKHADVEANGGREFFVRTLARLMDDTGLSREQVTTLIFSEAGKLDNDEGAATIDAMMPACELMKDSAGL